MSHEERTRARFTATAARMAAHANERIPEEREHLRRFVDLEGDEHTLDVGTGTGTLALALAPLVEDVVGLDPVPALLEHARSTAKAVANASFVEGTVEHLPYATGEFDLVACSRTLHHVPWPDVALAEMTRVTRTGGRLVIIDQIASADPLEALAHNRIERLRDPTHVRVLSDQDFRGLFDANDLVLRRSEVVHDEFELDDYLELAACVGEPRAAIEAEIERLLANEQRAGIALQRSGRGYALTLAVAWYLLEKVPPAPATTAT